MPEPIDQNAKTAEIKLYIGDYVAQLGFPPTFREIASEVNLSVSTVHHLIKRMVRRNEATMVFGQSRTLRLVEYDEDTGGSAGT